MLLYVHGLTLSVIGNAVLPGSFLEQDFDSAFHNSGLIRTYCHIQSKGRICSRKMSDLKVQ